MKEKTLEDYLKRKASEMGGHAHKLILFNSMGFPDRTVFLPGGKIGFVELKVPGNKPSHTQEAWLRKLKQLGFIAYWADSKQKIDEVLSDIQAL